LWFDIRQASDSHSYLPEHYFAYFMGLVILVSVLIGAIFLIRKWEKI
jgi:hypothetical protein